MKKVRMEVCKVQRYRLPGYPSKVRAMDCQRLLASTPTRWKGSPVLCAALALTVSAGMSGCALRSGAAAVFGSGPSEVIGDGIVRQGMVTPAAFLSEVEACQVIREEAMVRGLDLGQGSMILAGEFPLPDVGANPRYSAARKTWHGQLRLDGYNEQIGAGFEYVSKEDIDQWTQQAAGEDACMAMYRFHQTANRLTESMQEQIRDSWGHIGVFYDPGTTFVDQGDGPWDEAAYQQAQKEYKIEQLRLQVRDFLDWLAAEGII